jgi:hypothetical protein
MALDSMFIGRSASEWARNIEPPFHHKHPFPTSNEHPSEETSCTVSETLIITYTTPSNFPMYRLYTTTPSIESVHRGESNQA